VLEIKRQKLKNPESKRSAALGENFHGPGPPVFFSRPNERSGALAGGFRNLIEI
jgi:hypothetical protein